MTPDPGTWSSHALADLRSKREISGCDYLEFLRVRSMSAGIYELAAGSEDPQQPHDKDEIYYVISGRARFSVNGGDMPVEPGTVLFVAARAEHRFHSIEEDLSLLVVFAGD
jgi:mannose-6-phosphate isomerase-like protein (cupin superfamily)